MESSSVRPNLQRLHEASFTIKAAKCQLGNSELKYLGHLIRGGMIKPLESKIETINNWPTPMSKKRVRAFLWLACYYCRFLPNFSETAAPLSNLTHKKQAKKHPVDVRVPDSIRLSEEGSDFRTCPYYTGLRPWVHNLHRCIEHGTGSCALPSRQQWESTPSDFYQQRTPTW